MNKKVVYTCIVGPRDGYPEIENIPKDWDFVCFTSENLGKSDVWKTIKIVRRYNNPKDSRVYKLNPHIFLKKYDVSMWIDGNIALNKGWVDHVEKCLVESDITFLRHPEMVKGAYHEAQRCLSMNKDVEKNIRLQMDYYLSEGLLCDEPVSATGILIRRHNNLKEFHNLWWSQVEKYSCRDQISLPYARWKTELKYNETHFDKKKPTWFKLKSHAKRKTNKK